MNFKHLVLAAAVAFSVPAAASAATLPSTNTSLADFWSQISGTWWTLGAIDISGGYSTAPSTTALVGGGTKTTSVTYSWFLSLDGQAASGEEFSSSWIVTRNGSGKITSTVPGASASTFAVNDTYTVPGPEAGAGLGALAMGGLAFWMNRRRKEAVAA